MTIPAIAPPEIVLGHPAGARATMGELTGACNSGVRCDRIRSRGSQSGRPGNGDGAVECRLHLPLEFARVCFFSPTFFVLDSSSSGGISHRDDALQGGSATISSVSSEAKVPGKKGRSQKRDESEGKFPETRSFRAINEKAPLFQQPQPPHPALTSRERRPWHPRKVAISKLETRKRRQHSTRPLATVPYALCTLSAIGLGPGGSHFSACPVCGNHAIHMRGMHTVCRTRLDRIAEHEIYLGKIP